MQIIVVLDSRVRDGSEYVKTLAFCSRDVEKLGLFLVACLFVIFKQKEGKEIKQKIWPDLALGRVVKVKPIDRLDEFEVGCRLGSVG